MTTHIPRCLVVALLGGAILWSLPAMAEEPTTSSGALEAPWRSAWAALPKDPTPEAINNDQHYLVSNEDRIDLFRRHAKDRGGVQIGLGTDQNYLLAGWSRPEVLVLLDFDQAVVDLHAVYRAFFLQATDPDAFIALWSTPDAANEAIVRHTPDPAGASHTIAAYENARVVVTKRLGAMRRDLLRRRVPGFLTTTEDYGVVRRLYLEGRVVAVRGDLTATTTLRAISDLAGRMGVTIGVLYLSNAEQYFMYGEAFRDNMLGLPMDADSVVLRTLPARPRDFEYIIQRGDHFRAWLRRRRTSSVYVMRGFEKGQHLVDGHVHIIRAPR